VTNGSLLIGRPQCRPRYIRHNMATSIYQSDICRLHECVNKNNFKSTFVLSACYVLTVLRYGQFRCR
jgi:hypothetical protein